MRKPSLFDTQPCHGALTHSLPFPLSDPGSLPPIPIFGPRLTHSLPFPLSDPPIPTFGPVMSGAFVAGNDAGRAFNDWPMYAEQWVPEGITDLEVSNGH